MGRHSAPDDDVAGRDARTAGTAGTGGATVLDLAARIDALRGDAGRSGRHARGDAPDDADTAQIDTADAHTEQIDSAADVEDRRTQMIAAIEDVASEEHTQLITIVDATPDVAAAPAPVAAIPSREPDADGDHIGLHDSDEILPFVQEPFADEGDDEDDRAPAAPRPSWSERRRAKRAAGETPTQADLRLLRENAAVRAQCLGALVAAFAVYTVVLLVVGRLDLYLLWIWIPIVLAGVLVGALLDLAHRRAGPPARRTPSASAPE